MVSVSPEPYDIVSCILYPIFRIFELNYATTYSRSFITFSRFNVFVVELVSILHKCLDSWF